MRIIQDPDLALDESEQLRRQLYFLVNKTSGSEPEFVHSNRKPDKLCSGSFQTTAENEMLKKQMEMMADGNNRASPRRMASAGDLQGLLGGL